MYISYVAFRLHIIQTWPKGGSAKTLPVIEKIGKPPLSGEAGPPPIRRAKLGGKFLGFFREFSGKFREFSVIFGNFPVIFNFNHDLQLDLA